MGRKFIYVIVFFIFNPLYIVLGQQSLSQSEEIFIHFERRFNELDSLIFSVESSSKETYIINKVDINAIKDFYDSYKYEDKYKADVKYLKSKIGFETSGQTYFRLDKGIGFDEEDAVSRYDAKIQAELAWAYFQSSFYKRKGKMRVLMLENQIAQNKFESNLMTSLTKGNKNEIKAQHDEFLAGILIHRIKNLDLIYSAYKYLLRKENISSDEMLEILDDKTEAERMLAGLSCRHKASGNLSTPKSSIVKVDTISLMNDIRNRHFDFMDIKMRSELLEQKYENTNYLITASITPFIRYSHYSRSSLSHSTNVDVGIRFKLPLSGETRRKKQSIMAEKQLLSLETVQLEKRITTRIKEIIREIESLNSLSYGEIKRIRELKEYLEDRKEAYENLIGKYSMPARMKEYNIYLSCWENLISFQYKRTCLLYDLQLLLGDLSVETYCTKIEL